MPGLVLGTPSYMSPEQGAPDELVDPRADQYSLGCVLYEMLVGRPPFTGASARELLARHATATAPPLRGWRADVPPALEAALARALAKRPADRYSSIDAMAAALRDAGATAGAALDPTPSVPAGAPPARWWRRAHALLVAQPRR